MNFSERYGYAKSKDILQLNSMDEHLRNGVWNCLFVTVLSTFPEIQHQKIDSVGSSHMSRLTTYLWADFFKKPLDIMPQDKRDLISILKHFFDKAKWNRIYDLIEFVIANHLNRKQTRLLIMNLNKVLERELSAYRIVNDVFVPIVSDIEIQEVTKSLNQEDNEVREHLATSLMLLSNREKPDYRNSIKESISAVETMCKRVSQKDKGTLSDGIQELERSGSTKIHPCLLQAFNKLFAYTNDAAGIRHSLMEPDELSQEDAVFMLVACSAFTNYLFTKHMKVNRSTSK